MVDHFSLRQIWYWASAESFTRSCLSPIPAGKVMAQVTIDENDVNKDYPISYGVIGDAKAVLRQMIEEVKRQSGPHARKGEDSVAKEIKAVKEEYLKHWMPRLTSNEVPISPYRVIWTLMHTVDRRRTIITHDAGNPRDQMVPFYESIVPRGYIGWGKSTQLGTGLGLAMGAKLAAPDKLAVNVMGDVALAWWDGETAVRSHPHSRS